MDQCYSQEETPRLDSTEITSLPDVTHVISCAREGDFSNWSAIAHAIRYAITGADIIECSMGTEVLGRFSTIVTTQLPRVGRILTIVEATTLLKAYNCTDTFEHCNQAATLYGVTPRLQQVAIVHSDFSHSRLKDGTPNYNGTRELMSWLDTKGIVTVNSKLASFQADLTKVLLRIVQGN